MDWHGVGEHIRTNNLKVHSPCGWYSGFAPIAHRWRLHAAKIGYRLRTAKGVDYDGIWVIFGLHKSLLDKTNGIAIGKVTFFLVYWLGWPNVTI